jgi:hypothetical protein
MTHRRFDAPWAGLVTGPAAWMISFQLNYSLVPWECANKQYPVPWIAAALAAAAASGGLWSWASWRSAAVESPDFEHRPGTTRFLAGIGLMSAALFALVILLHAFAGLVFDGCER